MLGLHKHKFRSKNKLLSLDSTTITLCLSLFPWAKFRRAKGGVKAHVLLDHDDYLADDVLLTEAKRGDVKLGDAFTLNPGSIVAMDRGYNDYALFGRAGPRRASPSSRVSKTMPPSRWSRSARFHRKAKSSPTKLSASQALRPKPTARVYCAAC